MMFYLNSSTNFTTSGDCDTTLVQNDEITILTRGIMLEHLQRIEILFYETWKIKILFYAPLVQGSFGYGVLLSLDYDMPEKFFTIKKGISNLFDTQRHRQKSGFA